MEYNGDYEGDYQRVYQVLFKNQQTPGVKLERLIRESGVSRGNVMLLLNYMEEDGFDIYENERVDYSTWGSGGDTSIFYRLAL